MMITLCNGKGGTGKTTMTVLLAHALAEAGKKVAVHDLDPQGTATEWLTGLDNTKVELYKPAGSRRDYTASIRSIRVVSVISAI